jgi:hypothetical protein
MAKIRENITKSQNLSEYIYLGGKNTVEYLINKRCDAVRRSDGKCITSRMETMLVVFQDGVKHNVLRRRLRKTKPAKRVMALVAVSLKLCQSNHVFFFDKNLPFQNQEVRPNLDRPNTK